MLTSYRTLAGIFGALTLTLLLAPNASAGCGGIGQPLTSPSSWHSHVGNAQLVPASLLMVSDGEAGIVGFWHVKFVSKGSEGIPDGTEIDAGYSQWHSDGTEIMNSGGRSPLPATTVWAFGSRWALIHTSSTTLAHPGMPLGANWLVPGESRKK